MESKKEKKKREDYPTCKLHVSLAWAIRLCQRRCSSHVKVGGVTQLDQIYFITHHDSCLPHVSLSFLLSFLSIMANQDIRYDGKVAIVTGAGGGKYTVYSSVINKR